MIRLSSALLLRCSYSPVEYPQLAPRLAHVLHPRQPSPLVYRSVSAWHIALSPLRYGLIDMRTQADGRGRTRTDGLRDGRTERMPESARGAGERHHDERHHNSSHVVGTAHVFELDTAETGGEHSERPPDESLVV